MTDSRSRGVLLAAAALIAALGQEASAQTPPAVPLPRADATAFAGWLHTDKSSLNAYGGWSNRGLYGGFTAGWFWTDHLKSEIDAGASPGARFFAAGPGTIDGRPAFTQSEFTVATRRLALGQQYQFFRNAFFHPHVGAGAELTWETTTERRDPLLVFDPLLRQTRQLAPAQILGPDTRLVVRPFAAVGFKAYMTPRSYFRTDLRLAVRGGVDEVLWRFGLGVDFP